MSYPQRQYIDMEDPPRTPSRSPSDKSMSISSGPSPEPRPRPSPAPSFEGVVMSTSGGQDSGGVPPGVTLSRAHSSGASMSVSGGEGPVDTSSGDLSFPGTSVSRKSMSMPSAEGLGNITLHTTISPRSSSFNAAISSKFQEEPSELTSKTITAAPPPPSPPVEPGTAAIDPMDTAESPSDTDGQPQEPSSTAPLYERAFGKDPTQFDDPTVYDIRPISENLSKDEIRDILNVATWPESDLRDLTAGDPPDQDFSNAKPANQVNFSTFQTYVEPYIRPYTEEDVSFLKERGDRFTPYVIPNRGPKGYKEVWAAEDGLSSMGVDAPKDKTLDPNEARGSIENMDDSVAETDEVSLGPLTSRLLSLIRPVPSTNTNGTAPDNSQEGNKTETTQTNSVDTDMPDANNTTDDAANPLQSATPRDTQTKPTTYLPSSAPRPSNLPNPDHATYEARALAELRYIGFLPADQTTPPDYSEATDDEVCARLRTLQHALRDVSARNNLRRQRVLELTYERMAMQEYANIADDLDNQVNAAYLKRNRSLAKPAGKKGAAARSGGGAQQKGVASAAGTGAGGRGVSEGVKALMEKRGAWRGMIGGVVGFGRQPILDDDETVFGEEDMKRAEAAERELEAGEEGEA